MNIYFVFIFLLVLLISNTYTDNIDIDTGLCDTDCEFDGLVLSNDDYKKIDIGSYNCVNIYIFPDYPIDVYLYRDDLLYTSEMDVIDFHFENSNWLIGNKYHIFVANSKYREPRENNTVYYKINTQCLHFYGILCFLILCVIAIIVAIEKITNNEVVLFFVKKCFIKKSNKKLY